MKKFLVITVSFILAFCLLLSGTGCSRTVLLSFSNNFNDGKDPNNLKETLTYSVEYTDNYGDGLIKKDSELTDDVFKFEFKNGKYVQTLETLSFLPDSIETDIDVENTKILKLTGKLTIDFIYTVDGEEKTNNDYVEQEVYFLLAGMSFAPIYSSVKSDFTLVGLSESEVSVTKDEYVTTTEYNKETYTVTRTLGEEETVNDYEYEFRTAVDNNQLLFILRSLKLQEDATRNVPFVSPVYGEAKELMIKNQADLSTVVNVSYNGGEKQEETLASKNLSYFVNETRQAGSAQFVVIQDAKSDNFGNRALPLVYAETLTTYGAFTSMGALVYTISEVSVVNE